VAHVDVDFVPWSLHRVDMGSILSVSEVYDISVFRIKDDELDEVSYVRRFWLQTSTG
jgi:hypothetical protein